MNVPPEWIPLDPGFFSQPTVQAAEALIGKIFVTLNDNVLRAGRIVETEAYCGHLDPASHAFRSKTERNGSLFGPPGILYVYKSYGIHNCCNIVVHDPETGVGGVLLRAIEPLLGNQFMEQARKLTGIHVTNGPGKLGQALGITMDHNGHRLIGSAQYFLYEDLSYKPHIKKATRIGISKAIDKLWRFYDERSRYVSRR